MAKFYFFCHVFVFQISENRTKKGFYFLDLFYLFSFSECSQAQQIRLIC